MNGVRNFASMVIAIAGLVASAPCLTYASNTSQALKTVENNRLTFNFQDCIRSGSSVTCNLLVTNTSDRDRDLSLYATAWAGSSRVIDLSGNEYKAVACQAGQQQNNMQASVNLIRDVPIKIKVMFEVPVEVNALKVLSVGFNNTNVQFRDVAITAPKS